MKPHNGFNSSSNLILANHTLYHHLLMAGTYIFYLSQSFNFTVILLKFWKRGINVLILQAEDVADFRVLKNLRAVVYSN